MYFRLILPQWALDKDPTKRKVLEGDFNSTEIREYNAAGYNIFYLPNYPKNYSNSAPVSGSDIDTFEYAFVDMDLKDEFYKSKDEFIEAVADSGILPSKIVDSGHGVHCYYRITDLEAHGYLRFQRRLMRLLSTDEAVGQLFQLMRLESTINTKFENSQVPCVLLYESDKVYTSEELDKLLPPISLEDEAYCKQHYDKTHSLNQKALAINDELPPKFGKLLRESQETKDIWAGLGDDRSKGDYRLGHLMLAAGFSKDEAMSVLVNSAKALQRAPVHRYGYAENIVNKIWTYEEATIPESIELSESVEDILSRSDDEQLKGERFPCQPYFDGTDYGFRLGQVMGLVAGVGVGKTAIALNIFKGFVQQNPDYVHMFISLEMPGRSIALRWKKMCENNHTLHKKVHVLSNYNPDGTYRNLSLGDIQEYILAFQKEHNVKIGCVCIDHLGVLKQQNLQGEYQGLREICSQLKSFAIATNTMFIIQSQTNRDKAGIGDLELHKDAAYGTQSFESYLDFLMVCWQPLKRCYDDEACPKVTAYKFAKIREKSKNDTIIEDQCYRLYFDQDTEILRPMTQDQEVSFDYFAKQALNKRKMDRKTDLVTYTSIKWEQHEKRETT